MHTNAFPQRSSYTQARSHRESFPHILRAKNCTQRLLHRQVFFTHRSCYTNNSLHIDIAVFTHRCVYTQKLLRREAFTQKSISQKTLCTEELSHTEVFTVYIEELLAFTQRSLYTEELLHTEAFTQTILYTEEFLHTEELLHRGAFTHRPQYTEDTQKLLHRRVYTEKL